MVLATGERAPDFALPDQDGTLHRLSGYAGQWVVVYFYPKDETPGCVAQACSFRDSWERVQQAGISVLGVSRDTIGSHKRFADARRLPFPLLADPKGLVVKAFDAKGFLGLTRRVTYLVDPTGVIRFSHDSRLAPKGHVEAVLAAKLALESEPEAEKEHPDAARA